MLYPSPTKLSSEATSLIQLSTPTLDRHTAQTTITTLTQFDPSHCVAEGEESKFNVRVLY